MLLATPPITDVDPALRRDIGLAEGCKLVAYRDSKGLWTTGYGHLLDQSIDWRGHEITQATADAMLTADIAERCAQCSTLPEWGSLDTDCRRNAVREAVFNLGIGHWMREFPATRKSIRDRQWSLAEANLLKSPEWITEVGLKRVARLAGYLGSGSYSA